MKPIEIAEQCETTDLDGDALLAQSETKEGVVGIVVVVFKGEGSEGR
jgi:ribosomal protein S3